MFDLSVKSESWLQLEPLQVKSLISLQLCSQGRVLDLQGPVSLGEHLLRRQVVSTGLPVVLTDELVVALVKADVVQLLRASRQTEFLLKQWSRAADRLGRML